LEGIEMAIQLIGKLSPNLEGVEMAIQNPARSSKSFILKLYTNCSDLFFILKILQNQM
jgi:hypothetical protein